MTDKYTELLEAAKAIFPYLDLSSEETSAYWARSDWKRPLSKADRLRAEADEIEARDAKILRLRAAVASFSGE